MRFLLLALTVASCALLALAQQDPANNSTGSLAPTRSLNVTTAPSPTGNVTGNATVTSASLSSTPLPTTVGATNATVGAPEEVKEPPFLDTKIDATFGILGGILILTGLPMLVLGGKNRWTSYFFTGFYALSLICLVLILRFGVQNQVNPPSSATRGLFLFACVAAGVVGGGLCVLFFKVARSSIGAFGGFTLALFILSLKNNVLIRPIAMRYIVVIASTAIGFVLCTFSKLQPYVIIASTSVIGATAVVLGVDCYTTQNLKEYYVYISRCHDPVQKTKLLVGNFRGDPDLDGTPNAGSWRQKSVDLNQVNPPSSATRGLFLFACVAAGVVGGGLCVLFFKVARSSIGAFGGFTLALFILSLKNNVLIRPIAMRYIVVIASTAIGFVLCTFSKLQPYVIIASTSVIGATAVVLGVDCYTTQNLKEYYVYILGFKAIFPDRNKDKSFNVSDNIEWLVLAMQIELGVLGALIICGIAFQARILKVLKEKVQKIKEEDQEREVMEEVAAQDLESRKIADLARWEEKHNNKRASSTMSLLGGRSPSLFPPPTGTPASLDAAEFEFGRVRTDSKHSSVFLPTHSRTNSNDILRNGQPITTHPSHSRTNSNDLLRIGQPAPVAMVDEHPDLVAKRKELEEISKIRNEISRLRETIGSPTPNPPAAFTAPTLPPLALLDAAAPAIRRVSSPTDIQRVQRTADIVVDHRDLYAPPQLNQSTIPKREGRSKSIDFLSKEPRPLQGDMTQQPHADQQKRHSSGAALESAAAGLVKKEERYLDVEELNRRHKEHIRELQSGVTASLKEQQERENLKRKVEKMKQEMLAKERKDAENPPHVRRRSEVLLEETKRRSTSKVLDWQDGKIGATSSSKKPMPTPTKPSQDDKNSWLKY
ncbi:hypothetical protein BT69DRAFT_1318032 [Atractiella rhizophila]|nr:hypothetical protein BT69DRAFT_1318032 [Atractiella rhizophila]